MFKQNGKSKANLLIACAVLFMVGMYIMRGAANEVSAYADGAKIIDLRFGYTAAEAMDFLTAIGAEGRELYYSGFYFVDLFYPLTYALFYTSVIARILKEGDYNSRSLSLLKFLPLAGMILDWVENICIRAAIEQFPEVNLGLITASSYVTIAKFLFVYGSLLSIIALVAVLFIKKTRGGNR